MIMNSAEKKDNKSRTTGIEFNCFRIFMLLWILILLLGVSDFLRHFYSFLEDQEARYRASLPENVTEELADIFREHVIVQFSGDEGGCDEIVAVHDFQHSL